MKNRLINGNDVIEHAEVNGESREFVQKLIDYISDAQVVDEPGVEDMQFVTVSKVFLDELQGRVYDAEYYRGYINGTSDALDAIREIVDAYGGGRS